MTHTLHRQLPEEELEKDFVILSMAAQGYNDQGAAPKLSKMLEILTKHNPVNYGDDNIGSVFTGVSKEEMIKKASDKSYMDAVYTNINDLINLLKELREANLGISVTVTGDRVMILNALKEIGLKPNSIHLSLGIMGKKEMLPDKDVLDICSMCGHGMISPARVKEIAKRVGGRKISAEEGAKILGGTCTCGIFNVHRAEKILKKMTEEEE